MDRVGEGLKPSAQGEAFGLAAATLKGVALHSRIPTNREARRIPKPDESRIPTNPESRIPNPDSHIGICTTVLALRWVEIVSGTSFLLKYTFDSALSTALRSYFTTSNRR